MSLKSKPVILVLLLLPEFWLRSFLRTISVINRAGLYAQMFVWPGQQQCCSYRGAFRNRCCTATPRQPLARVRQRNYGIKYQHIHTQGRTEKPCVPQPEGKVWGGSRQRMALALRSLRFCLGNPLSPRLWIYSPRTCAQKQRWPVSNKIKSLCAHNSRLSSNTRVQQRGPCVGVVCDWCVFWHPASEIAPHAQRHCCTQRHAAPHKAPRLGNFNMSIPSPPLQMFRIPGGRWALFSPRYLRRSAGAATLVSNRPQNRNNSYQTEGNLSDK